MKSKVRINNEDWIINFVTNLDGRKGHSKNEKTYGICYNDRKSINIIKGLSEIDELDTIIHEVMHGECPYLTEEVVEQIGSDLAKILTDLGWRKIGKV